MKPKRRHCYEKFMRVQQALESQGKLERRLKALERRRAEMPNP